MKWVWWILLGVLGFHGTVLAADFSVDALSIDVDAPEQVSQAVKILVVLTVLSMAPGLLIVTTAFTRIVLVLAILRQALGMQQTPPNTVIVSLAMFLTLFTMMPVIKEVNMTAYSPYQAGELIFNDAIERAKLPIKRFMLYQTREEDLQLMLELSDQALPETIEQVGFVPLIPRLFSVNCSRLFKLVLSFSYRFC